MVTLYSKNVRLHSIWGESGGAVVEALCYKPEGRGFETDGVTAFFHWHNLSGRKMALGSTQPINRNEYQEYILGVKVAGA
jgi:hypothetical protein